MFYLYFFLLRVRPCKSNLYVVPVKSNIFYYLLLKIFFRLFIIFIHHRVLFIFFFIVFYIYIYFFFNCLYFPFVFVLKKLIVYRRLAILIKPNKGLSINNIFSNICKHGFKSKNFKLVKFI